MKKYIMRFQQIKLVIFLIGVFCVGPVFSQATQVQPVRTTKTSDPLLSKAIETYNKKNYAEALELLDSNPKLGETYPNWHYYRGLCYARLEEYDKAIQSFEAYTQKVDLSSAARAYYFIGLMQFYKGSYERAITTLDVALDVSKDAKLDRSIDNLIDKVIRYNNYYKNRKSTNLSLLLGYNYDSNVIDVSQELSETKLNGHVFNYGFSVSHRVVDKIDFVFEPSLTVLDTYSFSNSFKNEATLQQADVLQGILTLPVVFTPDKEDSNTQYELSLNAFTSFVPVLSTKRDQYLSSQFFKARMSTDLSNVFRISLIGTFANEQAVTFVSENLNGTGSRSDLKIVLSQYLTKNRDTGLGYEMSYSGKSAIGSDSRYNKINAAIGYWAPSWMDTSALLKLTAAQLKYPDRLDTRTDNMLSLDVYFTKKYEESLSELTLLLGGVSNNSNVDVNKYNDLKIGIAYTKQFGF